ncbi:hypothetical protein V6Z11_D02G098300 [Gossypium hirsutum]
MSLTNSSKFTAMYFSTKSSTQHPVTISDSSFGDVSIFVLACT